MPTYIGFSTSKVNQPQYSSGLGQSLGIKSDRQVNKIGKKFKLNDEQLIIQDFINAMNIKQGDKVGQPGYGTNLHNFLFDPNVLDVVSAITDEIRRLSSLDPRLTLNSITPYTKDNGILIEMTLYVQSFENPINLALYIDSTSGSVQQVY